MAESDLYPKILLLSEGYTRLFRQQAGLFWAGRVIHHTQDRVILENPRAVKVGVPGLSDIGGFTSVIVTPEMIGQRIAIYAGIEGKSARGRATPEQTNFINVVNSMGGRAGIARTVEDAERILKGKP